MGEGRGGRIRILKSILRYVIKKVFRDGCVDKSGLFF